MQALEQKIHLMFRALALKLNRIYLNFMKRDSIWLYGKNKSFVWERKVDSIYSRSYVSRLRKKFSIVARAQFQTEGWNLHLPNIQYNRRSLAKEDLILFNSVPITTELKYGLLLTCRNFTEILSEKAVIVPRNAPRWNQCQRSQNKRLSSWLDARTKTKRWPAAIFIIVYLFYPAF